MKPGLVRAIWLASVLCSGSLRAVSRMTGISIRILRPVVVRLLDRKLWGNYGR